MGVDHTTKSSRFSSKLAPQNCCVKSALPGNASGMQFKLDRKQVTGEVFVLSFIVQLAWSKLEGELK